jgi:hypothetical protein
MTFLVVGLDRRTLVPWHRNIRGDDPVSARRAALDRAAADAVDLVVAAVIGPNSAVLDHTSQSTALLRAA